MCGIIGYNGFRDSKEVILEGLARLEYRGYDSAGIGILNQNETQVFRCRGRVDQLRERLSEVNAPGAVAIGHTRWATHGVASESNAHPHRVGKITLVHNGIIENYLEHRRKLLAMGRQLESDTDSEVVAHLLDLECDKTGSLVEALPAVQARLRGSYALLILHDREPGLLVGVRSGAPLLLGIGEEETFLASDVQAFAHHTDRVVYLDDNRLALCYRERVEYKNEIGHEYFPAERKLKVVTDPVNRGQFRHYMLKEIHEQPDSIARTIEANADMNREGSTLKPRSPFFSDLRARRFKRLCLVACGTARYAALIGKYYLEAFARVPVEVDFGSEFRYRETLMNRATGLILISQSGETADTLAAMQCAKARGVPTLAICNVQESTLAREADDVLFTHAGAEIAVASTKAFTAQLTVLYRFALHLGRANGSLSLLQYRSLLHELEELPGLVSKVLSLEPQIAAAAERFREARPYLYLGRGVNYPVALEAALKIKEIGYMHAEGYPAGELKHGPIALVDDKTAVIVLAPQNRGRYDRNGALSETVHQKLMSNLQEVKSRGGRIWTLGCGESDDAGSELYTRIGSAAWGLNPILYSIPMQLFAYYVALQHGADIDRPRNLAKSVTVE